MTGTKKDQTVSKLIAKWRGELFLNEWTFSHKFVSGGGQNQDSEFDVAAEISVNYPYKIAYITTFDGFWNKDSKTQEAMMVHELCHCHTQELWNFLNDFSNGKHHNPDEIWRSVETLTQRISLIAQKRTGS